MTTKKSSKGKSGVKKLSIKNQTLRDLDAKTSAENVRGGQKPRVGLSAASGKC
jgi:hypothetical protein